MNTQSRLLKFVVHANWILFFVSSVIGLMLTSSDFAKGIILGGLIVTVNFHLLSRTLKNALTPPNLSSHNIVLIKYYIRFIITGLIICVLIYTHYVDAIGLLIGLSVVVLSIMLATINELKNIIFKEAV